MSTFFCFCAPAQLKPLNRTIQEPQQGSRERCERRKDGKENCVVKAAPKRAYKARA